MATVAFGQLGDGATFQADSIQVIVIKSFRIAMGLEVNPATCLVDTIHGYHREVTFGQSML